MKRLLLFTLLLPLSAFAAGLLLVYPVVSEYGASG